MNAAATPRDLELLREALELAALGEGLASPNPLVGAVVAGGVVVGRGHHEFARKDHAEVVALREAGEQAFGATLAVNLEPCSSTGRTPPCTRAILEAGIARVVAATADPDPRHRGRGFAELRAAGVEVSTGGLAARALRLNERYFTRVLAGRPHVTLKLASTLDGFLAPAEGVSRWLTGERARRRAHELRAASDAILVGSGTALADDPLLTVRLPGFRSARPPLRCVLDGRLRLPPSARLLEAPADGEVRAPVVVATLDQGDAGFESRAAALAARGAEILRLPSGHDGRPSLDALLARLGDAGRVTGLLVEGGGTLAAAFVRAGLVDRVVLHVAPILMGAGTDAGHPLPLLPGFGGKSLGEALRLDGVEALAVGGDFCVTGRAPSACDLSELLRPPSAEP